VTTALRLERVAPEAVDIPSRDVHALLDALIASGSELHGMMVLRHGKVAAEGWWAPYAAGQVHGSQSLTKTMTGSAFGVAMLEGLMTLDTKLTDIFPEYAPLCAGKPYWNELTMRYMTTMSAGMEKQPAVNDVNWIHDFFTMDIIHKPGTAFYYNSAACSMVGPCIRRITGLGLREYLRTRLMDPIGIDADHLKWHCHPDGMENGSGGLVSSTEDNARLMELYRCGGQWDGRQLLSPDWVSFALQTQNDHLEPPVSYCGMMWKREECFLADGAMGQWAMLFPEQDTIVSLSQTMTQASQGDAVLKAVFHFVRGLPSKAQDNNTESAATLARRLRSMAISAPDCVGNPNLLNKINRKHYEIVEGKAHFFADDLVIFNPDYAVPVRGFGFEALDGNLLLTVDTDRGSVVCPVGLKGLRLVSTAKSQNPASTAALSATMPDDNTLQMEIRWLESCRVHRLTFHFTENNVQIDSSMDNVGGFDIPGEVALALEKGGSHA
jgi:CubicO group peptidase (beta-lactamase class C family)